MNEMNKIIEPLQKGQNPQSAFANTPVLNMLNDLYVIYNPQAQALQNPNALGNAWFVKQIQVVENGDEEIRGLSNIDPGTTALMKKEYASGRSNVNFLAQGQISLTSYAPNRLTYSSNSTADEFAVFSDIYYREGKDWKVTLDGNEVEHTRVNYVLRAMDIPAGKHEIVFEFRPTSFYTGETISLIGSIIFVVLLAGAIFISIKKSNTEEETVD